MVTTLPDSESGDPYMQIVPPWVEAGPESASFSFSPITCSASALVTRVHASISPDAAVLARLALLIELEPDGVEDSGFWLQAEKVKIAAQVRHITTNGLRFLSDIPYFSP
jgi:hypothetical protein